MAKQSKPSSMVKLTFDGEARSFLVCRRACTLTQHLSMAHGHPAGSCTCNRRLNRRRGPAISMIALAWVLVMSLLGVVMGGPASGSQLTYILPILRCGINNQKMDLRQLAAVARVLDAGLVLTGMYQHYTDQEAVDKAHKRMQQLKEKLCFPPKHWGFMDFDRLFDRKPFADWLPVLSVDELRQQGWNGTVEALIHGEEWKVDEMTLDITMRGIEAQMAEGAPYISVKSYMNCNSTELAKVKDIIKPFRVVAMYLFGLDFGLFPGLHSFYNQELPQDACKAATVKGEHLLVPSAWVKGMADQFKQKFFRNQDYLAVHVRPYPDGCLDMWKAGKLDNTSLEVCEGRLRTLPVDVPTKVEAMLAKTQLKNLFIMSHPRIRDTIKKLLKKVNLKGITVAYLDMPTLTQLAGCINHSVSFMSMVEEVICAQAHSFIGTATSSITRTIVLMRDPKQAQRITWFEHDEPGFAAS